MEKTEAHMGKMETQLKQWGAKLDELVAKAEKADDEAKVDYRERLHELKAKYKVAQSRFDEVRTAGSDKWDTFKTGLESSGKSSS